MQLSRKSIEGGIMQVGDLVVEHINDRIGTIIKIDKGGKYKHPMAIVLMEDGSVEEFPTTYLGRYK